MTTPLSTDQRLTWAQIEKKAMSDEGIDNMEWMEAARRHIDNQKREINRLREQLAAELKWRQDNCNE